MLSISAPVTSVAKCITLAKCSTKGDSGTLVDVQNGSRASATERTAYSCSSRSLEDRARDAASAKSFSSSPVLLIVPAKTREVTMPRERRRSSSGVAPTKPATAKTQVEGYSALKLRRIFRASIGRCELTFRSRANTTFSSLVSSISLIACATRICHSAGLNDPSPQLNSASASNGFSSRSEGWARSPIQVIHEMPLRMPTTIWGITNTESSSGSNEKEVKRIGPVPLA